MVNEKGKERMKILSVVLTFVCAGPALAHPGHLIELAGHDHWLAGVAIGAAIAIGLVQGLKGKSKEKPDGGEDIDGEEVGGEDLQEA